MIRPQTSPGRPSLEVADIFRGEAASFWPEYGHRLSSQQGRVFRDIQACRTQALGGHVDLCDDCGYCEISYNSCRNRHCPKCQALARADWLRCRSAELLPVPYFHVVFTLPAEVAAVALGNKRQLYGMLFEAASQTLRDVAANPRHLGAAQIGLLAVLHTWGQNLMHHPHLHCVVSGGGLSADESQWIASRAYYFLPVKVLSRVFRNKFRRLLENAFAREELSFSGELAPLSDSFRFRRFLQAATSREWVVYAKRPFRDPACVLKYLAGYTHRVAISNHRLLAYRDGKVTFRYKDYARGGRQGAMTLEASEFIRRFLLHVLPDGFMRIRHYGYLANRHRQRKLEICRRLLGCDVPAAADEEPDPPEYEPPGEDTDVASASSACPACKTGRMQTIHTFERMGRRSARRPSVRQLPFEDSS